MAIVGLAKYTHPRTKFREDATRGERQNLETTDLARELESLAKSVVSNFWRYPRIATQNLARVRVYSARPTIAIAKIRDYSQSS